MGGEKYGDTGQATGKRTIEEDNSILSNALTAEVRYLDTKYFNQVGKFREDAEKLRQELESKG